ncbi:MAG: SDR family NAD(P)-dependent oxidoreductase [Chloroflexota bacterium]|nr:SDR family NAD(P)-dependent oxidoreductase [Chloroflexota bacterium]
MYNLTEPRVALITGASSGIGYATALAFARHGIHVAATARHADNLAALVRDAALLPASVLPLSADVRDPDALRAAVAATMAHFGRLDFVVANAGIGQRGSIVDAEWSDIEAVMRTNIDGVLHTIRATVPALKQAGGGHLVIVSSVVYNLTAPYAATYSASKAFVSSLARSLRLELEPDHITVTDLRIGRVDTAFNARRLGAAGYAARAPRLPVMSPNFVAQAIVRVCERRTSRAVALRWLDRAIMLANALIPTIIGRRALRQYKT